MIKHWQILGIFSFILLHSATPAAAMLRVLKYKPLAIVRDHQVCVYARHETSPKPEYRSEALNGKDPIVCELGIYAQSSSIGQNGKPRVLQKPVLMTFNYEVLTRACVEFPELKASKAKVKAYAGMTTTCATMAMAPEVFGTRFHKLKEAR